MPVKRATSVHDYPPGRSDLQLHASSAKAWHEAAIIESKAASHGYRYQAPTGRRADSSNKSAGGDHLQSL